PPPPKKVEPPPPPKCESLDENCKADADTRAKITHTSYVFTPVAGWVYAQTDAGTVAQANADAGPAMVVAAYDADKDAKKELELRDKAFGDFAKQVGLALPKTKPNWKKPTCT